MTRLQGPRPGRQSSKVVGWWWAEAWTLASELELVSSLLAHYGASDDTLLPSLWEINKSDTELAVYNSNCGVWT